MSSEITEEMVEAACKAYAPQWNRMDSGIKTYARAQMRDAISAALAARPAPEARSVVERLRADDLLYNRGPDYEPLRVKPSALRLDAADLVQSQAAQIASLSAKVAEVERERDEALNQQGSAAVDRDVHLDQCVKLFARAEATEAERDELRAAVFGGTNYASDLRNGNFVEMARGTERGRRGAVARATAAEARASELQREVERLRGKLNNAADTAYRMCAETRHVTLGDKLRAALQQEGESDE